MPKEGPEYQETVPLTDPVVEDISKEPVSSQPPPPPPTPPMKPATIPTTSSKNPLVIPLIIITLIAVIAASLFYTQNKQLKAKVKDLAATLEAQKIVPPPEPTSQPQPKISQLPSPTATPTATPQAKTEALQALNLALEKYPQAQLILITSNNPHLEDQKVTKYWFRQSETDKKYLYVSSSSGKLNLVDQQVYVSPDNNIPSLNQRLKERKLGLTSNEVLSFASSLCQKPEECQQATNIKTQFLDTGANLLWQVTYQIKDQSQPLVFQINSLTKEVVYQSQK